MKFFCYLPVAYFLIILAPLYSLAQNDSLTYPINYFRNPLGIPIQLAANFGEVRYTHFHAGLDIRTNQKENLPVFASADGYVSRISIAAEGYGNAIFIKHPNGYTTVYGHLNNFFAPLDSFVKSKQYAEQQWQQDFQLSESYFVVKKGQFIAYSGNTGSSEGPHLHFEIRKYKANGDFEYFNPLLFGLEVKDNIPPTIFKLFYYDRNSSTYNQNPAVIPIKKTDNNYVSTDSIVNFNTQKISFGIHAEDRSNATSFYYGINKAKLYFDDSLQFAWNMEKMQAANAYRVESFIDAPARYEQGLLIQNLSLFPSYKFNNLGVLNLQDTLTHKIFLEVKDEVDNTSTLLFFVKFNDSLPKPLYKNIEQNVYLLSQKSVEINDRDNIQISFPAFDYKDTIPVFFAMDSINNANVFSNSYWIGNKKYPTETPYNITLKIIQPIADSLKDRIVMQLKSGAEKYTVKGNWKDEARLQMKASFEKFGRVSLLLDTIAPSITPINWTNEKILYNEKEITVKVNDDVSGIKNFNAFLDGKWLLFSQKKNLYTYTFDERCSLGKHELIILANDEAGNIAKQTFIFTKELPRLEPKKKKKIVKHKQKSKKKKK